MAYLNMPIALTNFSTPTLCSKTFYKSWGPYENRSIYLQTDLTTLRAGVEPAATSHPVTNPSSECAEDKACAYNKYDDQP